jgi:phosphoglycerol transferase
MGGVFNLLLTGVLVTTPLYVIYCKEARKHGLFGLHDYAVVYCRLFFVLNLLFLLLSSIFRMRVPSNVLELLSAAFNMKHFFAALLTNCLFIVSYYRIIKCGFSIRYEFRAANKLFLASLCFSAFILSASFYFRTMYGVIPLAQLVFYISLPSSGAHWSMVESFVIKPVMDAVIAGMTYRILCSVTILKHESVFFRLSGGGHKKILYAVSMIMPFTGILSLGLVLNVPDYIEHARETPSNFYEQYYINPENIDISFPEKKRNLIVIFIESLETGFLYLKPDLAENVIPEVVHLAENNLNFSQTDGLGGANQMYGTEWTIAGIAAQYSGVPLAIPVLNRANWNSYGLMGEKFMPKASGVGDVLSKAGYTNYFILGSDAKFGGRDKYFETHKDTIIFDYKYFQKNHYIPEDYNVWWGFEDRKLYRFAKEKLLEISEKNAPFFFTLLTADTHPVGGYLDDHAERKYKGRYENVLADMSKQLNNFIEWVRLQDFHDNTTIVILGDHLYQDSNIFPDDYKIHRLSSRYESIYFEEGVGGNKYKRRPLNIFINSLLNPAYAKNREFSHFDMFPALIDSIGGRYDSAGLGLGRSMNKGEKTLIEQIGRQFFDDNLKRKSDFYDSLYH